MNSICYRGMDNEYKVSYYYKRRQNKGKDVCCKCAECESRNMCPQRGVRNDPVATLVVLEGLVRSVGIIDGKEISREDDMAVFGIAQCNTDYDNFNKEEGKKLAMLRALQMLDILIDFPGKPRLKDDKGVFVSSKGLSGHAPASCIDLVIKYFNSGKARNKIVYRNKKHTCCCN